MAGSPKATSGEGFGRASLRIILHDYGWIHRLIGVIGNLAFVVGSVLFLPAFENYQTVGVWLFIGGSALKLRGALGELLLKVPSIARYEGRRD